jgi:non-heme chloroperoxidase
LRCSNFAHAAFAVLMISGSINTMATAEEVRRVSANGSVLAYIELGQGEPLIFVHGGLQDYRMWLEHHPKFARRYHVIAYSRRNNYPNETSPDGMPDGAADVHGEDLAAFVRALGLPKVRIVAHSSGAHAALFLAASHPDMVKNGIPLFVDGVGGPGAYDRRSTADKKMNADNVASYLANATTKGPRAAFTCDMAKAIAAPVLLSNGGGARAGRSS